MIVLMFDDKGKLLYGYTNIESIWYSNGYLHMGRGFVGCIKVARCQYSYFTIEGRILVPFNK